MTSSKDSPPTLRGGTLERQLDLVVTQAGSRKGKAFLMVSTGEKAGTVFPLTHSSLLIGRSPEAEVQINEQAISNEHARLEVDGSRFTIRDLGSTNGTYVNGERVVDTVALTGGDSIRAGSTTFTFVTRETGLPPGTVRLRNPDPQIPIATRNRSDRPRESHSVTIPAAPESEGDPSVSLTDMVRTVKTYWVYAKRYSWLATTALFFGMAVGIAQARLSPPPGSAWFEMTLTTETGEDGIRAFVAPESTFKSLPLIKKTLADLGAINVTDDAATDIQKALTFEQLGYNSKLWRGDYRDATAALAVAFLQKHLDVYVNSEIDKIVKVLRADAEFDLEQEKQAETHVTDARNRLIEFTDEHPEAVPKDAKVPDRPTIRLPPGASAEKIAQSIGVLERSLRGAYSNIQSKKARPYIDQATEAETKIADARARGLRDEHPEIKNLTSIASGMRARANQILNAEPSGGEQSLDPEVVRLQHELAELRARLAQAQAAQGSGDKEVKDEPPAPVKAADGRAVPQQSLAQLKLQYAELSGEYERAKVDLEALRKKRETTDRQLERERKSAEARYDIITPPTPEATSIAATMLKRGGMGGAIGLGLALIAAACLELRRTLIARGHL